MHLYQGSEGTPDVQPTVRGYPPLRHRSRHQTGTATGAVPVRLRAFSSRRTDAQANRLTKSSAVWATSGQPWSIVREWPRFGIFTISVTAGLRLCRL
jgi:hypothetical protein